MEMEYLTLREIKDKIHGTDKTSPERLAYTDLDDMSFLSSYFEPCLRDNEGDDILNINNKNRTRISNVMNGNEYHSPQSRAGFKKAFIRILNNFQKDSELFLCFTEHLSDTLEKFHIKETSLKSYIQEDILNPKAIQVPDNLHSYLSELIASDVVSCFAWLLLLALTGPEYILNLKDFWAKQEVVVPPDTHFYCTKYCKENRFAFKEKLTKAFSEIILATIQCQNRIYENFEELFKEEANASFFMLSGFGGAGKTTQLLHLADTLCETPLIVDKKRVIPIYIPLHIFNTADNRQKLFYPYLCENYSEYIAAEPFTLKTLLKDPRSNAHIVLLCDGLNECIYGENIIDELQELTQFRNVSAFVTTRFISPYTSAKLKEYDTYREGKLEPLTSNAIISFLGDEIYSGIKNTTLEKDLLYIPMLLQIYKSVAPTISVNTKPLTKVALLEAYFNQYVKEQFANRKLTDRSYSWIPFSLDLFLPLFARSFFEHAENHYHASYAAFVNILDKTYERLDAYIQAHPELINSSDYSNIKETLYIHADAYLNADTPQKKRHAQDLILSDYIAPVLINALGLVVKDEQGIYFSHNILQDYFAVKSLELKPDLESWLPFINMITEEIALPYVELDLQLDKRLRCFSMAEFFFEMHTKHVLENLPDTLDGRMMLAKFYSHYTAMFNDLADYASGILPVQIAEYCIEQCRELSTNENADIDKIQLALARLYEILLNLVVNLEEETYIDLLSPVSLAKYMKLTGEFLHFYTMWLSIYQKKRLSDEMSEHYVDYFHTIKAAVYKYISLLSEQAVSIMKKTENEHNKHEALETLESQIRSYDQRTELLNRYALIIATTSYRRGRYNLAYQCFSDVYTDIKKLISTIEPNDLSVFAQRCRHDFCHCLECMCEFIYHCVDEDIYEQIFSELSKIELLNLCITNYDNAYNIRQAYTISANSEPAIINRIRCMGIKIELLKLELPPGPDCKELFSKYLNELLVLLETEKRRDTEKKICLLHMMDILALSNAGKIKLDDVLLQEVVSQLYETYSLFPNTIRKDMNTALYMRWKNDNYYPSNFNGCIRYLNICILENDGDSYYLKEWKGK